MSATTITAIAGLVTAVTALLHTLGVGRTVRRRGKTEDKPGA